MRQHRSACVPALIVALLAVPPARGGETSQLAIIDRTAIEDFPLQGEYVGKVKATDDAQEIRTIGLQVVSLGHQKFRGVEFVGGLPGAGWDGSPPRRWEGTRDDRGLVLGDEQSSYRVIGQRIKAMAGDQQIGQLRKIERVSPTLNAPPPQDALVLFDGTNSDQFKDAQVTEDGLLMEGPLVNPLFQDFSLHIEFLLPYMPYARGQGRSNSGVYLQTRYEVQVLDSFGLEGKFNECGSLYRFRPPDVNMCFPPLTWQTYDIDFSSPRWNADGSKRINARITVRHNGGLIHDRVELPTKTGNGAEESSSLLPIRLQNHQNPVRYRNIWIVDRGLLSAKELTEEPSEQPKAEDVAADPMAADPPAEATTGTDGKDESKESPEKVATEPASEDQPTDEPAAERQPTDKSEKMGNDQKDSEASSEKE